MNDYAIESEEMQEIRDAIRTGRIEGLREVAVVNLEIARSENNQQAVEALEAKIEAYDEAMKELS